MRPINRYVKKGDKFIGNYRQDGVRDLYKFMCKYYGRELFKKRNNDDALVMYYFLCTKYFFKNYRKNKFVTIKDVDFHFLDRIGVYYPALYRKVRQKRELFEISDEFRADCEYIMYKAFYEPSNREEV